MSLNDDGMQAGSDSFWEIGKYMSTVKRCDNGYLLCSQLKKLIEERSELEKKYAGMLQEWNRKWNSFLDRDIEYGTTEGAWRGVLTESDEVANMHIHVGERLVSDVYASIKSWQKENYHKSMMHFKETKELEENFRKAQKPWAKRMTKVLAAKKDYHSACRAEKSTTIQEQNAKGDSTSTPEQIKKLEDKLHKCQQEVESTRDKYNAAINDINDYNAKYIEDMNEVYKKSQEFEQKRIEFFKKAFFKIHACLDLTQESGQIYSSLQNTISNVDYNKDLKLWSNNHGNNMAMNWPVFEEYSPELQAISKRSKTNLNIGDGGIVFTGIKQSRDDNYVNSGHESGGLQTRQLQANNMQASTSSLSASSSAGLDRSKSGSPANAGENPFGEPDENEDAEEPPSEGWSVRALYDYVKAEDDELEFKAGDIFIQLATEDDMGWCKGRKNGKVGLYPKNYVERI